MSKIVITGSCGFLGSHCVDVALDRGLEVVAVCAYRPDGTVGHMEGYRDRVEIVRADIGDISWLRDPYPPYRSLEELPIINCAALVSVPYSRHMPNEYWRVNTDAVVKLAQLCPKLVHVSTSEVFDGRRTAPYRVDSPRSPVTPYGASKAAAECAVLGYSRTGRVVRIFNLFGPRQYPRAVHPIFIRAALRLRRGLPARLAGPHGSRAFLYAPWVARQLVNIAVGDARQGKSSPSLPTTRASAQVDSAHSNRLYQIASDECIPIEHLWRMVADTVGVDPQAAEWDADAGHSDVPNLYGVSSSGIVTPSYSMADLETTVQWYEENPDFAAEGDYQ